MQKHGEPRAVRQPCHSQNVDVAKQRCGFRMPWLIEAKKEARRSRLLPPFVFLQMLSDSDPKCERGKKRGRGAHHKSCFEAGKRQEPNGVESI